MTCLAHRSKNNRVHPSVQFCEPREYAGGYFSACRVCRLILTNELDLTFFTRDPRTSSFAIANIELRKLRKSRVIAQIRARARTRHAPAAI